MNVVRCPAPAWAAMLAIALLARATAISAAAAVAIADGDSVTAPATAPAARAEAPAEHDTAGAPDSASTAPEEVSPPPAPPAGTGTIAITLSGVRARDGGQLIVSLYRGPEGWLKSDRAFARRVVPVAADSAAVTFTDVPLDTAYAVAVVHDKNGNGKMDMRILPYPRPKEGAGVSGNAVRRGPPKYERARFALDASTVTLRIVLRY